MKILYKNLGNFIQRHQRKRQKKENIQTKGIKEKFD